MSFKEQINSFKAKGARRLLSAIWIAQGLIAGWGALAAAPDAPALPAPAVVEPLDLDASDKPLGGALRAPALWSDFKGRFVSETGRVIDFANGAISHSEGQGYGMLFAVAANDRIAFDRIWTWTRANLMVRDDELIAWRWEPTTRPAIADMNDAADGDILVAWALTEAAEYWGDLSYRVAARRVAVEVGRKLVLLGDKRGPILLPAISGFAAEARPDGPILNLSYWVFPAFERLPKVAPEVDWDGLVHSGVGLVRAAEFGPSRVPSDWVSAHDAALQPASGFRRAFSYNALRIPLYLAMAGVGEREDYAPFVAMWGKGQRVAEVDVDSGLAGAAFEGRGYAAIAELTRCVVEKTKLPGDFYTPAASDNYYQASLHILAVIAARQRYSAC
jgi:endoglucanase